MRHLLKTQHCPFVHHDGACTSQARRSDGSGKDEQRADETSKRDVKGALAAIALCAGFAVAMIVVRLVAFHPRFAELLNLQRTAELLATGLLR